MNYKITRDADFLFGVPILGRLLFRKGPEATLNKDYTFSVDGNKFIIPAGYRWNGNSIPAILWGTPFNYMPWGVNIEESLKHDFLCDIGKGGSEWLRGALFDQYPDKIPHKIVHEHFYYGCLINGMPPIRAKIWYFAVRIFGPKWKL